MLDYLKNEAYVFLTLETKNLGVYIKDFGICIPEGREIGNGFAVLVHPQFEYPAAVLQFSQHYLFKSFICRLSIYTTHNVLQLPC